MTAQDLKKRFMSDRGIIGTSAALLILALFESSIAPWAPFFFVFAAIGLVLPLVMKSYRFGGLVQVFARHWRFILVIWAATILWDQASSGFIAKSILSAWGVLGDPGISLPAFTDALLAGAAVHLGVSPTAAMLLFALIAVVWAPIGEELFYRGYIFGGLRERHGFAFSGFISSAFFGLRHILPVFFFFPRLYWIPAVSWGIMAFVYGFFNTYLYEKTGSLAPCMIGHALLNIVSLIVM